MFVMSCFDDISPNTPNISQIQAVWLQAELVTLRLPWIDQFGGKTERKQLPFL